MIFSSVLFSALLFGAPPQVAQQTPDVRLAAGAFLAGNGFTGSVFRSDNTVTVKPDNLINDVRSAINALASPPAIDWTKQGVDAPTTVMDDNTLYAVPQIEQLGAYTIPYAVRNKDGYSRTQVLNPPRAFGLAGFDPIRLYQGELIPIVGRHLAATLNKPTIWLQSADKQLFKINPTNPGGRGTGHVVDLNRSTLWFEVPTTVPAGNYSLYAFHGENRYGITPPLSVTITATPDPWKTATPKDVLFESGQDITDWIAEAVTSTAGEDFPLLLRLPPGVFYLSKQINWGSNVGIIGAGNGATRLVSKGIGDYSKPSEQVGGRGAMIRIVGENTLFKDLTLELTPGNVRHIISASGGTNRARFDRVRFYAPSPRENSGGYCDGALYRFGRWQYWRFLHCDWECQRPFEATNGPTNGFKNNGAFDNGLIQGGTWRSVHGLLSGSAFESALGRSSLIHGLDISRTRRGLVFTSGDGCLESVISACHFHDMWSEFGNGEPTLFESRPSAYSAKCTATADTITIEKDTQDRTRWTLFVLDGTGKGQYRVIKSSAGGTHTLETPWEIVPDKTSRVLISQCPTDCTIVFNRYTSTVGGINLYGNAFGCVLCSNWLVGSHEGIMLNTNWDSVKTQGVLFQEGDGRSMSAWHSFPFNRFEDGVGFHFVAARSSYDFMMFPQPQIAWWTATDSQYAGDVTNQLWATEGTEQKGNVNGANLKTVPLINWGSIVNDKSYSGKSRYNHDVIDRVPLRRNVWYKTPAGVGTVLLKGSVIDDIAVKDSNSVITVSPEAN